MIDRSRELGGPDPLDAQLGGPRRWLADRAWARRFLPLLERRAAFGLRAGMAPALVLVPAGFLLGPQAANVLSLEVLAHLQVAVSIGLALLGAFVGRALAQELRSGRVILAGNLESLATLAAVGFAMWFLIVQSHVPVGTVPLLVAVCLGVTASASSAHAADQDPAPAARMAARIADCDDLVLIIAGAVALVWIRGTWGPVSAMLYAAPAVIGASVAAAGLLLFPHTRSAPERGLLMLGAMALIGGASAYLMTSSLAAGLVAGTIWGAAPGHVDRVLDEDAQPFQHLLVALLLIVAGAFFAPRAEVWWLLVPYVLFRIVGKMIGAYAAARLVPIGAGELAASLVPPGVIGIGFSLTFMVALPADAGQVVVSVAAAGTLVCEAIALLFVPASRVRDE